MAVTETKASLVIQHTSLSAARVTEYLAIEPTSSFEHGDLFRLGKQHREHSNWTLESPLDDSGDDLQQHIQFVVDRLAPRRDALERLVGEGYEITCWCLVTEEDGQGGLRLSRELLGQFGALPIHLQFDIYAGDDRV